MTAGKGKDNRDIYKGNRRSKVATMVTNGMSHRTIAEQLGIGKSTVARDIKYLKQYESMARAQDALEANGRNLDETRHNDIIEMPTNLDDYRAYEREQVIIGVEERKTYKQIAKKLDISVATVLRHVNAYISEYGDFGGRTMLDWRNEHLLSSYKMMAELVDDMECQPIRGQDAMGDESGWDLTPFQAGRTRAAARKQYAELMKYQAQLLQLLVQKTEIDVEHKVVIATLRNVDLAAFPPQGSDPVVLEAEY